MALNYLFVQTLLHLTREYKTVKLTKWILILRRSFFLIKIKTRVDKGDRCVYIRVFSIFGCKRTYTTLQLNLRKSINIVKIERSTF